jgi:hypothetical protein
VPTLPSSDTGRIEEAEVEVVVEEDIPYRVGDGSHDSNILAGDKDPSGNGFSYGVLDTPDSIQLVDKMGRVGFHQGLAVSTKWLVALRSDSVIDCSLDELVLPAVVNLSHLDNLEDFLRRRQFRVF